MKTLGQFLIERRKAQGLSQKEFAALIKNRDGKPPDYLLEQFANVLKVGRDVFYFWAQRMPPDIRPGEADEEQVTAAYRAFRREAQEQRRGEEWEEIMKMIPDRTGRFPERPYYEIEELEEECERIMESFLMSRYGQYSIPVPTDAFVEMLDRETAKLNLYCDLSAEGEEVHGVTEFFPVILTMRPGPVLIFILAPARRVF
jgi:transcriptional regulator with XRE-family HTH domain